MIILIIVGVIVLVLLMFLGGTYNSLVRNRVKAEESWSGITVQLKRRLDLIPNLVKTVKAYAKHEAETLEKVVAQRAAGIQGGQTSPADAAKTENMLSGALKSIFAVAESYPDLKANQNFLELQAELTDTEDKIQAARRFYNSAVTKLNTKIESFPSNFVANMFKFKKREFFDVDESERATAEKPVSVDF